MWKGIREKNFLLWGLLNTNYSHDIGYPEELVDWVKLWNSGESYTKTDLRPDVAYSPDRETECTSLLWIIYLEIFR